MSEYISLNEWINNHNINKKDDLDKLKNIFYMMDYQMKTLHENNYYINDFGLDSIYTDNHNVYFSGTSMMDDTDDKVHYKNKNIYYFACLELGIYSNCLKYINPNNKEYFRSNFNDFLIFIPVELSFYYKGIFVDEIYSYLSDFIDMKTNKEIDGGESISMSKSTLIGKMFADVNNSAAFVRIILFPFIILLLSIIIPLMAVLNS